MTQARLFRILDIPQFLNKKTKTTVINNRSRFTKGNQILLTGTCNRLKDHGFEVLLPQSIPFNDGCIAVGQAAIVNALLKEG